MQTFWALVLLAAVTVSASVISPSPFFRPPAVPLISMDPYMNIWAPYGIPYLEPFPLSFRVPSLGDTLQLNVLFFETIFLTDGRPIGLEP